MDQKERCYRPGPLNRNKMQVTYITLNILRHVTILALHCETIEPLMYFTTGATPESAEDVILNFETH